MKNFIQWAEDMKIIQKGEPVVAENGKRTGYSGNYPPGYVSAQYPDLYFVPIKATAPLDKENMNKPRKG